jgi:hypothetical protein
VSASFRVIETATTGRTGAIKRDNELEQIELLASLDDEQHRRNPGLKRLVS